MNELKDFEILIHNVQCNYNQKQCTSDLNLQMLKMAKNISSFI